MWARFLRLARAGSSGCNGHNFRDAAARAARRQGWLQPNADRRTCSFPFREKSAILQGMRNCFQCWIYALALLVSGALERTNAAEALNWNTNQNRVTANIQSIPVAQLLAAVSRRTGWEVFLEPNV